MNRSQSKIRHMQQVNVLLEQRKLKLVEQGVVPPSLTTTVAGYDESQIEIEAKKKAQEYMNEIKSLWDKLKEEDKEELTNLLKQLVEQRKLKLVEQGVVPPSLTTDTTTIRPEPEESKPIADIIGLQLNKEITCSCPELKEYMGKVNQKAPNLTGTFQMIDGDTVKFTAKGGMTFTLTLNVTD